ncbi:hypothetical protein HanPSC8_Chr04g0140811 [Helianthus annuus]|nr:hypothetical protein HanPSC8_Chr04g0140811 [Helianthus annuus]
MTIFSDPSQIVLVISFFFVLLYEIDYTIVFLVLVMLFLAVVSAVISMVVLLIVYKLYVCGLILGFEALSGDDGGLLFGVATMFAAVAALSRVLLVPAMMKGHSEPFTLNQFGEPPET